jgi:predicted RNA binding protein YcfA (HicA-like mRNA interferase family)
MSPKAPRLTGKQIEKSLLKAGWYRHHSRGSHFYYRHPEKGGRQITIPIHAGEIIPPRTLGYILEQADLTLGEFLKLF